MENEKIDWTSFRQRIVIEKPIDDIYASWTTQSNIEQWFLERAHYYDEHGKAKGPNEKIKEKDTFSWKWNNWNHEEKGEILCANGKDTISFTFGPGGNVCIELKEKKGATEIILTQNNIPTDDKSKKELYVGCSVGWAFWLTNLKAWLEHGITLNAKGLSQEETTGLVNS